MALLFTDPCDNFTFAPWTASGTAAVTASGHTGNGFNFPIGGSNSVRYNPASGDQTDSLTVKMWVKWVTLSASPATFMSFRSDAGATTHNDIKADTSHLYVTRAGTNLVSPTVTLTTGTWYLIEVSVKLADSGGTVSVKLDGTVVATFTGDTKAGGTKTVYDALVITAATGSAQVVDDIIVRNDIPTGVTVKVYNGTSFVDAPVKVYNGSAFVDPVAIKTWNGSAFV